MKDEDLINHQLRMLSHLKNEQIKLMQLQKLVYRVDNFIESLNTKKRKFLGSRTDRSEHQLASRLLIECSSAIHFLIGRYQLPTEEVRSDACKIEKATEVHGTGIGFGEGGEKDQDWHEPDSA